TPQRRPLWHAPAQVAVAPIAHLAPAANRALAPLGFRRRAKRTRGIVGAQGRRILMVLDHPGLLIHFDQTIAALLARGHTVVLAFARMHKFPAGLAAIDRSNPRLVVHDRIPDRVDWYAQLAGRLRAIADYVHYLDPRLAGARYSRAKWRDI